MLLSEHEWVLHGVSHLPTCIFCHSLSLLSRPKSNNAYILVYERKTEFFDQAEQELLQVSEVGEEISVKSTGSSGSTASSDSDGEEVSAQKETNSNKSEQILAESVAVTTSDKVIASDKGKEETKAIVLPTNKQEKVPIGILQSSSPSLSSLSFAAYLNCILAPFICSVHQPSHQVSIPDALLRSVWSENSEYLLARSVFSNEYFSFIWTITNLYTRRAPNNSGSSEVCSVPV